MAMTGRQFIRWVKQQRYPGMGADVHPYFEKRTPEGTWEPLWGWGPHPDYWWENIADQKVDSGAVETVIEIHEGETPYVAVSRYFKAIPLDKVLEIYGTNRLINRTFYGPDEESATSYEDRFRRRDYLFFGAVANVRSDGYHPRGLPEDMSEPVRDEIERWEGDAHSHTWFMCSEMLADPKLNHFRQVDHFIRKHISDPENTRVVMFFDN